MISLKKSAYILLAIILLVIIPISIWFIIIYEPEEKKLSEIHKSEKWLKANPEDGVLHSGDLICRHGRGVISNAFKSFSVRESKFSHTGIISIEKGKIWVYHAIGGEENKTNKMRKEELKTFCDPRYVHSFAAYRYDLDSIQTVSLIEQVKSFFEAGLEFDTDFDMKSDDRMYCSEFIYKVLLRVTGNENYLSLTRFSGYEYVAIDDLYLNSHTQNIYQFTY